MIYSLALPWMPVFNLVPIGGFAEMDILYVASGFALGVIITGAATAYMLRKGDRDVPGALTKFIPVMIAALALLVLFGHANVTHAQTAIEIPTDTIFEETNNWIETFAPIAAIGIGITVALAVLGYLGKMIASAFKA